MSTSRSIGALLLALFILPAIAVWPAVSDSGAMILPIDDDRLTVINPDGSEASFSIEIARTPSQQSAGLMFRLSLADDHGMLFIFDRTRRLAFWMKNTALPLDIIFVAEDGRVIGTFPGKPYSLFSVGPNEPARFVLEVKSGFADRNGIVPGSVMRHPAIDAISGAQ